MNEMFHQDNLITFKLCLVLYGKKIGAIERRLMCPMPKSGTQNRETIHLYLYLDIYKP